MTLGITYTPANVRREWQRLEGIIDWLKAQRELGKQLDRPVWVVVYSERIKDCLEAQAECERYLNSL